jgi:hypothetical protein
VDVVKDVRQTEMHTAEPLIPKPSSSEVGIVTENWKNYKSPDVYETSAGFVKADSETLHSKIHRLMHSICNEK